MNFFEKRRKKKNATLRARNKAKFKKELLMKYIDGRDPEKLFKEKVLAHAEIVLEGIITKTNIGMLDQTCVAFLSNEEFTMSRLILLTELSRQESQQIMGDIIVSIYNRIPEQIADIHRAFNAVEEGDPVISYIRDVVMFIIQRKYSFLETLKISKMNKKSKLFSQYSTGRPDVNDDSEAAMTHVKMLGEIEVEFRQYQRKIINKIYGNISIEDSVKTTATNATTKVPAKKGVK